MRCKLILNGLWIAMLCTLCGCADSAAIESFASLYRTIRVEPRRDTDAAQRINRLGLEHLEKGELDEAATAFERALTADVEFAPAHNNLGKVYFLQKHWYKAAWEFEYAAKLLPRRAEPRNNLGLVLEHAGELDRAIEQFQLAVGLDEDAVEYRGNLARALIRRGDRTEQVRSLLQNVIDKDTRTDWVNWARRWLVQVEARRTS